MGEAGIQAWSVCLEAPALAEKSYFLPQWYLLTDPDGLPK